MMIRQTTGNLAYYQFKSINDAGGVAHGVFTRAGGSSKPPFASLNVGSTVGDDLQAVQDNRHRMAEALDVRDEDVRTTWQVHSADVVVVRHGQQQPYPLPRADAIITPDARVPLAMRFADCVPLLFYDPVQRVLAMAHAGWRGTLAGVGPATVATMRDAFACNPEGIIAGVGPSIGPDRYEVGPEVVEQVRDTFGDSADTLVRASERAGHGYLDLWEANRLLLNSAGVVTIEVAAMCTAKGVDEWFSHRAEKGQTGRFGMLAVMPGGVV